jgi:hypothetical protein
MLIREVTNVYFENDRTHVCNVDTLQSDLILKCLNIMTAVVGSVKSECGC